MLRKTARRGRSAVPARWRRIRSWRLRRAAPRLATCVIVLVRQLRGYFLPPILPALPALRRICSPAYRTPLPLYGSGLRVARTLRRDLADELLVDADDREAGRVLELEADAGRRVDLDRVAVAEAEQELLADLGGAVADADDLEALAEAVGHADDHVVDERAGQAVELLVRSSAPSAGVTTIVPSSRSSACRGGSSRLSVALRALDRDAPAVDRDVDAGGNGDGKTTDSRHRRPTRRTPGLRRRAGPCWPARRS